ncbi:MAG: hypothetical protein OXG78_07790 [Chloroflexi bacterium]|nr:hypothetical protein [Chloroflexota bacterium]
MQDLTFLAPQLQRQRLQELMEEARIERFLAEKKNRDAVAWQQRRLQRQKNQS